MRPDDRLGSSLHSRIHLQVCRLHNAESQAHLKLGLERKHLRHRGFAVTQQHADPNRH